MPISYFLFILAALLHFALIFFAAFSYTREKSAPEPAAAVMKLTDIREESPPPPPPPEKPRLPAPQAVQTAPETAAETMIETEAPVTEAAPPQPPPPQPVRPAPEVEYLPQSKISEIPAFPEDQIRKNTVYPPIALRSNIEGRVYLELFIDPQGNIRRIEILREEPPDRGFAEAAVKAFNGIKALSPAKANGVPVAVRYRYAISFRIK